MALDVNSLVLGLITHAEFSGMRESRESAEASMRFSKERETSGYLLFGRFMSHAWENFLGVSSISGD